MANITSNLLIHPQFLNNLNDSSGNGNSGVGTDITSTADMNGVANQSRPSLGYYDMATGNSPSSGLAFFKGVLDMPRLDNVARTRSWFKTVVNNYVDGIGFYSDATTEKLTEDCL